MCVYVMCVLVCVMCLCCMCDLCVLYMWLCMCVLCVYALEGGTVRKFLVLGCKVTAASKRQEDPTLFLCREGVGQMISGSWVGGLGDWHVPGSDRQDSVKYLVRLAPAVTGSMVNRSACAGIEQQVGAVCLTFPPVRQNFIDFTWPRWSLSSSNKGVQQLCGGLEDKIECDRQRPSPRVPGHMITPSPRECGSGPSTTLSFLPFGGEAKGHPSACDFSILHSWTEPLALGRPAQEITILSSLPFLLVIPRQNLCLTACSFPYCYCCWQGDQKPFEGRVVACFSNWWVFAVQLCSRCSGKLPERADRCISCYKDSCSSFKKNNPYLLNQLLLPTRCHKPLFRCPRRKVLGDS